MTLLISCVDKVVAGDGVVLGLATAFTPLDQTFLLPLLMQV